MAKTNTDRYVNAYNKASDNMNNGGIKKYNDLYTKKIIKKIGVDKEKRYDYTSDKDYINGYKKLFNDTLNKHYNNMLISDIKNDKYYKKGKEIVDTYGMVKWDENAKDIMKISKK